MCCPGSFNGVCGTISGGCRNIGTEPCCPSGSQNDVADTCCWGVQAGTATKTDNDNCCPSTQVVAYTLGGAGSVGKYCCPTNVGGSSAVVVPDGKGGFTCCPSANVLRDENNVLHCCPTAIDAANTRWRPQFDPQNPTSTSGTNVCCPVAQLNTPTDDVCCPATGGPYSTSTETKCWCVAALCMLRKSLPVLCAVLFDVWLLMLIYLTHSRFFIGAALACPRRRLPLATLHAARRQTWSWSTMAHSALLQLYAGVAWVCVTAACSFARSYSPLFALLSLTLLPLTARVLPIRTCR